MENQIPKLKRIEWIDTAKGIGLLLVILGHLHVPYMSAWIYTFHMPLFFFLSGVVFSGDRHSFKKFCIKRIKSLVVPYFCLGFVIYLFYVFVNAAVGPENGLYGTNLEMLKKFFIQEHFWTIWFLACLFVVEILYYCIWKVFGRNPKVSTFISICVCVWGLLRYRLELESLPWNIDVALVAQFFFHVGYLFEKNLYIRRFLFNARKTILMILVLGALVANISTGIIGIKVARESLDMSVGLYGNEMLTMFSAFAGITFIVVLSNNIKCDFLTYLGQNTMIIFAWHSRIIIVLCEYIYDYFGLFSRNSIITQLMYVIITFVIILVILIPINEMIKKSKIHKLFGV